MEAKHTTRVGKIRKAYILLVVLGFVAIASSLGLAFLTSTSTVMPEAVNYAGSIRAAYLASSGVGMASHYIMYPPTTVPYGQYYTGANNVTPDASSDYYNVTVLRSDGWSPPQTDMNLYRITALGVAKDGDGSVRAKKSIVAEVQAPLTGRWNIPYAALTRQGMAVSSVTTINGDAHANNNLSGTGWCQGKLSGAGLCSWTGFGPPASLTPNAPPVSPIPAGNAAVIAAYSAYTIQGKNYTAYTGFSSNQMTAADSAALNAIDMSATNPGRIIMAPAGNFKLRADVNLTGTLVVQGILEVDDWNDIRITAVPNFPALVVTSNIKFLNDGCDVIVLGPVILGGRLDFNNHDWASINVTGPTITQLSSLSTKSTDSIIHNYSAQRAVFWDFENVVPPQPMTVLSWKEN